MWWCLWAALAADVDVAQSRLDALVVEPTPLPTPWVDSREVHVDLVTRTLRSTWTVHTPHPGWLDLPLSASTLREVSVTVDGAPADLVPQPAGHRLALFASRNHRIELIAALGAGDPTLQLLEAGAGTLTVRAPKGHRVQVDGASGPVAPVGDAWWTQAARLTVRASPAGRALPAPMTRVEAEIGLTVADAEVVGRARLHWRVLRGEVQTLELDARHLGADAELVGPGTITRRGDRWQIALERPTRGVLSYELRWSHALPNATTHALPIPELASRGARLEQRLVLARDSELQVVPDLTGGRGIRWRDAGNTTELVEGSPAAAWTGPVRGSLSLLRFEPAEQPPLLVDVADWWLTTTAEGRQLTRGVLTVRNERAAALELSLPPGHRLLSVQVDGEPRTVAPTARGVRVELPRSVDTVQGPLAFPVEMVLLGDGSTWSRKAQPVSLPAVGAPVAVRRVRVHLPPGWAPRGPELRGQVEDFAVDASLAYGFGDSGTSAEAESTYREAVDAWMDNDFDTAQAKLDDLRQSGLGNDNVGRLQSNLDLVNGTLDTDQDGAVARRVREQAWARGEEDRRRQDEELREADKKAEEGDYEGAEILYSSSLQRSSQLQALEQEESVEQAELATSLSARLSVVRKKKAPKGKRKEAAPPPPPEAPSPEPAVVYKERTEIDFDGLDVSGELVKPAGALLMDLPANAPVMALPDEDRGESLPEPEPLQLMSTQATVVMPGSDATIRLQHRLLVAWDDDPLLITARPTRTP